VVLALRALASELDRLDDVASRRYGLNRTDMRALEIVSRAGPVAPSDLARLMDFTTGGITTVIDRLEKAGYVSRRAAGTDRRRLVIQATEATASKDQEVFAGLVEATGEFIRSFKRSELAAISRFLDGVRNITAHYTAALGDETGPTAGADRAARNN
jgi:DNA-binding MarR family transcriptional regulator